MVAGSRWSVISCPFKKKIQSFGERKREKSFVVKGDAMTKAPNPRPLASVLLASALAPAPPSLMMMMIIIVMAGPCGAG
jgi:hypothetical protein